MKKKNIEKFSESLDLEAPDDEEQQTYSRRVQAYSVAALRAASTIDRIYIQHTAFASTVKAMDRLFQLAPELNMPYGMILNGPSGVGKTAAFKYFRDTLPSSSLFAPGDGAIGLRCPKRPRVGHFVAGLLKAYKYPFAAGTHQQLYIRRGLVFDAIKQKGTRLIFIDEASGLLSAKRLGSSQDGDTEVSEFLREVVDECKVALVLAGPQELEAIEATDTALSSRLSVRESLKLFEADASWIGVLKAFARESKAFDIRFICEAEIPQLIHMATGGSLRSLKRLIMESILVAVDQKLDKIDSATLSMSQGLAFGSASQRPNVFA